LKRASFFSVIFPELFPSPLRRPITIVALGLTVLCVGACATAGVSPATTLPPADLDASARVLAAADARRPDTAVVSAAIASRAPAVRREGALAAGQLHLRALAPTLRALLHDPDSSVAARAAFALALLRDTAGVASLDSALIAPAPVAVQAAFALGEIGEAARGAILAHVDSALPLVRAELLMATAKLRPVPAEPATRALSSSDPCVRWAAAYALSRPRVPAGVRALIAFAHDSRAMIADTSVHPTPASYECAPSETRAQVARALVRSAAGDSLEPQALGVLRTLSLDKAPHVRINALRSLATFGDSAVAPIVSGTRDHDPNVRIAAAQSLAGRMLARELWLSLWNADSGTMYRRSLLESATHSGVALPAHDDWRAARDWHLRAALADAAALAPTAARGTSLATSLLADPDPRVRQSAVGAVAAFLDSAGGRARRQAVVSALRDPDFFVRATALLALADSARPAELPAVIASYQLAARDSGNDARIAAIRYVATVWKRDSSGVADSVRHALALLPSPDDPLVRAEALGVTPLASWAGVEGSARDLDWYRRVVREVVVPTLNGNPLRARIESARGPITLELLGEDAPLTVANFVALARRGFYRNVQFHRVVPNFVAQDGDPRGDGNGGPGYAIRDELNARRYKRGAVGMALSGPDTGGSQYFLTLSPQPHLDARYTIFAWVVAGDVAMDSLVQGDSISNITVP
jgi:cyclophilin family peptidyl-prolyl cis-trans isomerase/HEAT repeat protein